MESGHTTIDTTFIRWTNLCASQGLDRVTKYRVQDSTERNVLRTDTVVVQLLLPSFWTNKLNNKGVFGWIIQASSHLAISTLKKATMSSTASGSHIQRDSYYRWMLDVICGRSFVAMDSFDSWRSHQWREISSLCRGRRRAEAIAGRWIMVYLMDTLMNVLETIATYDTYPTTDE